MTGPLSRGVDALGAPWPDRPAREVEVPPRGEPMPADVDRAWDMCDVCGDPAGVLPGVAAPLPGGDRVPGPRTARLVAGVTAGWRLAPMTCSDRTVILKWTGPG